MRRLVEETVINKAIQMMIYDRDRQAIIELLAASPQEKPKKEPKKKKE